MILGASMIPFLLNIWITARKAPKVTTNDPWGYGASLEWATSCPPPRHNFVAIPRIRSERPAFDVNHPEAGIRAEGVPPEDANGAADPVREVT
jgi:cytochrome c oxidase subunit 1